MKLVTLSALVCGAAGGALVVVANSPAAISLGFDAMLAGWVLLGLGGLLLAIRIGWEVLIGQVLIPLIVAGFAMLLFSFAAPLLEPLRAAVHADGVAIGLQLHIFAGATSTIYALLVAFLVFTAMQDHNNINAALQAEALHLDSMSEILPHLHDQGASNAATERRMHELLLRYADNVLSKSFAHESHLAENQRLIDGVIDEIYRLRARDESDRISLSALVKRVDQLASLRAQRIAYMGSKPAPLMLVMLIVLSVMLVAPYFLFSGPGEIISQGLVGALAFLSTYLFSMLLDMFSHFHGYWAVDRAPFADSRDRIQERLDRPLSFAPRTRLAS